MRSILEWRRACGENAAPGARSAVSRPLSATKGLPSSGAPPRGYIKKQLGTMDYVRVRQQGVQ